MPKYVQPCDRENEVRAMEALVKMAKWESPLHNFSIRQCSDTSSWDGEMMRNGQLYAIVEVRGRNGDPERYREWHTRKAKLDKIKAAANKLGVKFVLIVTWDGQPYAMVVTETGLCSWKTHVSGRTDRNNPLDWEELYLIPSSQFKKI
jgi:hypothetical protein